MGRNACSGYEDAAHKTRSSQRACTRLSEIQIYRGGENEEEEEERRGEKSTAANLPEVCGER